MSWRYAPELFVPGTAGSTGEPSGWSTQGFRSARLALEAGRAYYGDAAILWTAWVVEQPYAAQLPSAEQLLAEAKERAAERGADTTCFDSLTAADRRQLEDLLRRTVANWEEWLVQGPNGDAKRSTVVIVENQQRHMPKG